MKILNKRQILMLHQHLVDETGGSPGLRDEGLLDSALNAPFQTFGDTSAYPSLQQKAARLCYGLVKNHPFIDGNKRMGLTPCWFSWLSTGWSYLTRSRSCRISFCR